MKIFKTKEEKQLIIEARQRQVEERLAKQKITSQKNTDKTELELFKLRVRLVIVQELALKTAIAAFSSATGNTLEESRGVLLAQLERTAQDADSVYLQHFGDVEGALAADEFREIVDSIKAMALKLPVKGLK